MLCHTDVGSNKDSWIREGMAKASYIIMLS